MRTPDKSGPLPQSEDLHVEVVTTVADEEGCDAIELPPLHDVIDPMALERLFQSTPEQQRSSGEVSFRYCDRRVSVDSQGNITVE